MPTSLPALAAGILRSDQLWHVRSDAVRFEAAGLTPAYTLEAALSVEAQADRAAHLVAELARKLGRLPEAFAWWPVFEPGPYFDLYSSQIHSFCRVEELQSVVRVRIYADLLLPAFRRAEAFFIETFLPAYHAAAGLAPDDAFSRNLADHAIPGMIELLRDAELAVAGTLARLEDQLDVLALLGGLEERIQHRPPPGSRLAPRLPLELQRMPREMPTLTLDAMFNGPERRPFGRDAWLHFQQAQGVRQSWPNND
ncbi:MAG: hypothetical protein KDI12_22010 [Anaerolineae bacterium]|nr:hypothetical protein [Anaerolineae bacterium]MCB0246105.1 hypothetical protein [Anaerolineae bacterium]HRX02804.1 hypothetical protein [Anaerolineae bacterium]